MPPAAPLYGDAMRVVLDQSSADVAVPRAGFRCEPWKLQVLREKDDRGCGDFFAQESRENSAPGVPETPASITPKTEEKS
jgi:hypothetical protein